MATHSQVLHSLEISLLKNIRGAKIDFKEDGLTSLLGPNGSGKSTIIYALLCLYQPRVNSERDNYRFSDFFTPTNYNLWAGSDFLMTHSYSDGPDDLINQNVKYGKRIDRWAPRYYRRPRRYVKFISISDCIPAIELEKKNYRIRFDTNQLTDAVSQRILNRAGRVMNRNYTALNTHNATHNQVYIGLEYNGVNYTTLNMGAGEQKIIKIISEIEKSPNNGLLVIDEIETLLHHDALKRLLIVLNEYCIQKHLQIIYTTHNHSILNLDFIDHKHIQQTSEKTIVHSNTNTDSLYRLTGEQLTPYEIFVEDELSKYIINQVTYELGIVRETSIKKFGATANCFTVACGAKLAGLDNFDNMLFVLDGDVNTTEQEKRTAINRVLTGNVAGYAEMRDEVFEKIIEYSLTAGINPENHIRNLVLALDPMTLTTKEREIYDALNDIENPLDHHDIIFELQERLGLIQEVTLTHLIDLASKAPQWNDMTTSIREWFNGKMQ